ncbi:hypothetical protein PSEUDO8AS_10218 [Pseudomonas sp. 8AS]|nr:hypothetical protein PSEUDO8AS_10218 [Pseudomonas sp. 8AS]
MRLFSSFRSFKALFIAMRFKKWLNYPLPAPVRVYEWHVALRCS